MEKLDSCNPHKIVESSDCDHDIDGEDEILVWLGTSLICDLWDYMNFWCRIHLLQSSCSFSFCVCLLFFPTWSNLAHFELFGCRSKISKNLANYFCMGKLRVLPRTLQKFTMKAHCFDWYVNGRLVGLRLFWGYQWLLELVC